MLCFSWDKSTNNFSFANILWKKLFFSHDSKIISRKKVLPLRNFLFVRILAKRDKITVQGTEIAVISDKNVNYISLTDMAHNQMEEHINIKLI